MINFLYFTVNYVQQCTEQGYKQVERKCQNTNKIFNIFYSILFNCLIVLAYKGIAQFKNIASSK